jgi:hypothetical protein
MATIVKPGTSFLGLNALARQVGVAGFILVALCACTKAGTGQDEMGWARAVLERNDKLQVVAVDSQARTFTVRLKDSGELRIVPIDQLTAGPAATGAAISPSSAAAVNTPSPPAATVPATTEPGREPPAEVAQPPSQSQAGPAVAQEPSDAGAAASPAQSASAEPSPPVADAVSADQGSRPASAGDSASGRMLASGPGYSIKASGARNAPVRVASAATTSRGIAIERLHDPIICQGSRLLHIDNRNLEFDGDAVSAEDGCEIHITNSRITAKGIGISARAANVHIENSQIQGDSGAIEVSQGAQIYAESSTFKGLTRRMSNSDFHDLGGNSWN